MSTELKLLKKNIERIILSSIYSLEDIKPSEWAEKNRILTPDVSPYPGRMNYKRTPYMIEPLDCLSPMHPARIIAVMKGSQNGFSTGVIESGIGWIMSQNPGNIMFLSGGKDLSKEAMDKKVDQMIDSCGLREIIGAQTMRKKNQRTGDTSTGKEFPGGSLVADATQNLGAKMKQRSIRYGFIDDFESAPYSDKKGGSTTALIETRFKAYYNIMKLYYISTPELKQNSNIEQVYLNGDQRHYYVPCPECGEFIDFHWFINVDGNPKEKAGIYYKTDENGKLITGSVGYICQKCSGFFKEKHKYEMNLNGEWRPTEEPSEPGYYSYLINSLYSPVGMAGWVAYVREWLKANPKGRPVNVPLLKTFVNTVLAQTYEDRGEAPKANYLSRQIREYEIGLIPEQLSEKDKNGRIVLLTCACDLNGSTDDARLDYEIVAWSESGSSYSIDHGSIGTFENRRKIEPEEGRDIRTYRNNEGNDVWQEFSKIISKEFLTEKGRKMNVMVTGVDTGNFTIFAETYIQTCGLFVIGLKGKDHNKVRRIDLDTPYYSMSRENSSLFLIYVNLIKDDLANIMKLRWNDHLLSQPLGYMNFPNPADGKYNMKSFFGHYESEHRIAERNNNNEVTGLLWVKKHSSVQNHFWDCRVYNIALKEIMIGIMCKEAKIKYPSWSMYVNLITGQLGS